MDGLYDIGTWLGTLGNDTERLRLLFVTLLGLVGFSLALAVSLFATALLNPLKKRIS